MAQRELQEPQRQLAEHDRQLQERRERMRAQWQEGRRLAQRQPAEHGRQLQERWELLEGRRLADGVVIRRLMVVPERNEFRRALEQVANFVDNERAPRPRPDDREWRIQREKTIRTLDELREQLDTLCVGANYGKAAGNSVEILGVGGAIVGAIMCFRGLPSGQTCMDAGNLLKNAGKVINGVSNVIELGTSANYLNDIDAVLKRDQELSRPLAEWLDFSNELDANVQEIFGVSLASEQINIAMGIMYEFVKILFICKDFTTTMKRMNEGRYSMHINIVVKVEKLQNLYQNILHCPQLGNRMRAAFSALTALPELYLVYQGGVKLYRKMRERSSSSVEPFLQNDLIPHIPTARQVTGFCFFQAISMATSVISLINTASIIRHGESKYSDAIKQLTRALTWELRRMDEL